MAHPQPPPRLGPADLSALDERIRHEADTIRQCFTSDESVADQTVLASKLLIDFAHRYSLSQREVRDTFPLRGEAARLERDDRRGIINPADYKASTIKIADQLLRMVDDLEAKALAAISGTAVAEFTEAVASARPQVSGITPLHEFTRSFTAARAAQQDIVFECSGLEKRYSRSDDFALRGISLKLKKGEITGVLGVNGSGKSTLLRIIAGTLAATAGTRSYPALGCGPKDWVTIRRRIAFVAQRPERWPGTVDQLLVFQAACFGQKGPKGREEVDRHIARLGLDEHRHKTWGQLSGGYRTRVELARALLSRPAMLVLDEPLAALDPPAQLEFLDDLGSLAAAPEAPMPILLSSQHIYEVEALARQILVLDDGAPVYCGPTNAIGQDITANCYEIQCDQKADGLACFLSPPQFQRIQHLGVSTFLITTSANCLPENVLAAFHQANVPLIHFRDVSRSCRTFFDR